MIVIFALFGAALIGASFAFPFQYSEAELRTIGGDIITVTSASGIGDVPEAGSKATPQTSVITSRATTDEVAIELERLRVSKQIAFLNQLPSQLDPGLPEDDRQRVQKNKLTSKLLLMRGVWGDDWARFEDFELWAEGGGEAVDSDAFRETEKFFNYGQ